VHQTLIWQIHACLLLLLCCSSSAEFPTA
jgi:hypothetical protein